MKHTIEDILKIGTKVLKDIDYWDDEMESSSIKFCKDELYPFENVWLVSFPYGAEDYGTNLEGKSLASMHVVITDETGIAIDISYRNGFVLLGYDEKADKYFIKERRP